MGAGRAGRRNRDRGRLSDRVSRGPRDEALPWRQSKGLACVRRVPDATGRARRQGCERRLSRRRRVAEGWLVGRGLRRRDRGRSAGLERSGVQADSQHRARGQGRLVRRGRRTPAHLRAKQRRAGTLRHQHPGPFQEVAPQLPDDRGNPQLGRPPPRGPTDRRPGRRPGRQPRLQIPHSRSGGPACSTSIPSKSRRNGSPPT